MRRVSRNIRIKVQPVALFYFGLFLAWQIKPKLAWRQNFRDNNIYYYRATSCFVKHYRRFLWPSTQFLRYLEYMKNRHVGPFLLFKISQKLQMPLKSHGQFSCEQVISSTSYMKIFRNIWLYLLELNLLKKRISA